MERCCPVWTNETKQEVVNDRACSTSWFLLLIMKAPQWGRSSKISSPLSRGSSRILLCTSNCHLPAVQSRSGRAPEPRKGFGFWHLVTWWMENLSPMCWFTPHAQLGSRFTLSSAQSVQRLAQSHIFICKNHRGRRHCFWSSGVNPLT